MRKVLKVLIKELMRWKEECVNYVKSIKINSNKIK